MAVGKLCDECGKAIFSADVEEELEPMLHFDSSNLTIQSRFICNLAVPLVFVHQGVWSSGCEVILGAIHHRFNADAVPDPAPTTTRLLDI
jgi:hypothetical protein